MKQQYCYLHETLHRRYRCTRCGVVFCEEFLKRHNTACVSSAFHERKALKKLKGGDGQLKLTNTIEKC